MSEPAMYVDAAEVARLFSLPSPKWVLAEARANRIPHVRLGHYVRFDPVALRAWAKAREQGPPA